MFWEFDSDFNKPVFWRFCVIGVLPIARRTSASYRYGPRFAVQIPVRADSLIWEGRCRFYLELESHKSSINLSTYTLNKIGDRMPAWRTPLVYELTAYLIANDFEQVLNLCTLQQWKIIAHDGFLSLAVASSTVYAVFSDILASLPFSIND